MHKLTPVALTTLTALLTFSGIAFAEESAKLPDGVSTQKPRTMIQNIRDKRTEIKSEIKDIRKDSKIELKDLRQDTKDKMKGATSSDVRREIKKDVREERKEIKDERKETVNAMKEQLKVLARQHGNAMGQRFGVAIKQFDNLSARIQSRIDKLKTVGIDTNSAESALNTAKIAIEQAKTDAKALSDLVAKINSATDAKALRPQVSMPASSTRAQVETAVKKVNASIKSAHRALEAASKQLVTVARSQRRTATSTREDN